MTSCMRCLSQAQTSYCSASHTHSFNLAMVGANHDFHHLLIIQLGCVTLFKWIRGSQCTIFSLIPTSYTFLSPSGTGQLLTFRVLKMSRQWTGGTRDQTGVRLCWNCLIRRTLSKCSPSSLTEKDHRDTICVHKTKLQMNKLHFLQK